MDVSAPLIFTYSGRMLKIPTVTPRPPQRTLQWAGNRPLMSQAELRLVLRLPEIDANSRVMQDKETGKRRDQGGRRNPPGVGSAKENRHLADFATLCLAFNF